jgi:hypothetical protein
MMPLNRNFKLTESSFINMVMTVMLKKISSMSLRLTSINIISGLITALSAQDIKPIKSTMLPVIIITQLPSIIVIKKVV